MKTNSLSFRVYVTPEEKSHIMTSARDCRMSMSTFCRTLALGAMPTSKLDLVLVDKFIHAMVDLNRLGSIMKVFLTNVERLQNMGRDMPMTTIDDTLVDIRHVVEKLREVIDAIHGVPIDSSDENVESRQ